MLIGTGPREALLGRCEGASGEDSPKNSVRRAAEEQRSASGTKHTKACVPCTVNDTGKRPRARAFSDISFGICLDLTSWAQL